STPCARRSTSPPTYHWCSVTPASAGQAGTCWSHWSSTRWPGSTAVSRSGPPDKHQAPVIGSAAAVVQLLHQVGRAASEPRDHHLVGLAEQPVNPDINVHSGPLDQAVGVQHQRITASERAALGHIPQIGHYSEHYAARACQPPRSARGLKMGRRRVASRANHIIAGSQVKTKMYSGNESLDRLVTPEVS